MVDERFSLSSYLKQSKESSSSNELSQLLEKEIQNELHKVLEPKMQEIVSHLNSMGHKLTLYYPAVPGDISYRDESAGESLLRVASDCVVSVGFSDTVESKES